MRMRRAASRWLWCVVLLVCSGTSRGSTPGDLLRSFPAPSDCPSGLAWDGQDLWMADWREALLYRIDRTSGQVLSTISAPCFWPQGLAWGRGRLFVSNIRTFANEYQAGAVYVLDPESGLVERSYATPGRSPRGLGFDGRYLLLVDDAEDMVYRLNPDDGTTISSFRAPSGDCQGLCFDGTYLWISDRMKDEIYMVTDEGLVVMTISAPASYACDLAWDGTGLWNVDFAADSLFCLETRGEGICSVSNCRETAIEFTHAIRNQGPGSIREAQIYLAVPEEKLRHQALLSEVRYTPPATEFKTDHWGQKVAVFRYEELKPGDVAEARYVVEARIGALRFYIRPERVGRLDQIPAEITRTYLSEGSRYFLGESIIRETASQVVGDETNPYWIARRLFEYEIDKVDYELAGAWDIAPTILKRGSGSCSEYAFLYIALCRAAGLPARYQAGVSHRGDDACMDNVYHRWVEVYLPNYGWIPVDPSRGDQPWPSGRAASFGMVGNGVFITTHGGGDSEYMGWTYNSHSRCRFTGKCDIVEDSYAIWEPIRAGETKLPADEDTCEPANGKECR